MKIYVNASRQTDPRAANVYKIVDALHLRNPDYRSKTKQGYSCRWLIYDSTLPGSGPDLKRIRIGIRNRIYRDYKFDAYADGESPARCIPEIAYNLHISEDEARKLYNDIYWEVVAELKESLPAEQQKFLQKIKDRTGIECKFGPTGNLIIPYAE